MRTDLLTALEACADPSHKVCAREFLTGLSFDELQFIAEFVGAAILEPGQPCRGSRALLAARIEGFRCSRGADRVSQDEEHKMILLLEFLCRGAVQQIPASVRFPQG